MATLQFRRGSDANLQNIIPAAGEPIWNKDLEKLKVGDGIRPYSELPFVGDVAVDGSSIIYNGNQVSLFGFDSAELGSAPVKSDDGKLEWKLLATQEDIEQIQATVDDLSDYIDNDLASKLEQIETELAQHDDRLDELYSDIFGADGIEGRLDAVEDQLAQVNPEAIEAAINRISGVEARVSALEPDVAAVKDDVEDLKSDVQDLQDQIDEVQVGIDGLDEIVNGNEEEGTPGLVDQVDELIDIVSGQNGLSDKVQALDNQINSDGGLEDRIEALEESGVDIDTSKIYTTDDIMVIDGGTADTVLIEAHDPQ